MRELDISGFENKKMVVFKQREFECALKEFVKEFNWLKYLGDTDQEAMRIAIKKKFDLELTESELKAK